MLNAPVRLLRRAKMQRVSEVLQLSIIIEGRRPLALEPQPLEKRDFLLRCIAAEGRLLEEGCQPRLLTTSNSLWVTRRSSSPKGCFAKIARRSGALSGGHLRRINA